jgi:hypothetical protein
MRKKIIGIVICMILLMPAVSISVGLQEPHMSKDAGSVNVGETEQVTCYFYGLDGRPLPCVKEIPKQDAKQLSTQLQAASKAFVTLYAAGTTDEERSGAENVIDSTLSMMDEFGVLPDGVSKEEAKQVLQAPHNQAKRLLDRGVIGSAGVGLIRPLHPAILPKAVVFWAYMVGVTLSAGLNGINVLVGPQHGFALFFVGLILSIGVAGVFFGFTPFTFYR